MSSVINPTTNITSDLILKEYTPEGGSSTVSPKLILNNYLNTTAPPVLMATGEKILNVDSVLEIGERGPQLSLTTIGENNTTALKVSTGVVLNGYSDCYIEGRSTNEGPTRGILYTTTSGITFNGTGSPYEAYTKPFVINFGDPTTYNYECSIKSQMTAKTGESSAPKGVEFTADAQFNIKDSNNNNVKVRISDLYDPSMNMAQMANVISALCRRVYTYSNTSTAPATDESTGTLHANGGGEIGTDKDWIKYYACQNLDSGAAPGNIPD